MSEGSSQNPSDEGWSDPVNLLSELAAPPFTGNELPAVIAAYPSLYATRTGIDPSLCLASAATVCAAALADQFQLAADHATHWYAQPRLWCLGVAPSGSGKSPAVREMQRPLIEIDGELRRQYEEALQGLGKDDPKPPRECAIVAETTIEALSEVLKNNHRGVLVANDEFESWLGGMDAYTRKGGASRDRGEWLRTFDGGPNTVERVQRGSVHIPNWGVSILTSTTPAAMTKLTKHLPEDGLLQRFIPIIGRRQEIRSAARDPGEPVTAAYEAYRTTVRRLYAARPRAHRGIVSLSQPAADRFQTWRTENLIAQEALGSVDSALESHVSKYPTLLLRLALSFHAAQVVNHVHEEARDPASWPVPIETLETAIRFLRRASQHALTLYLSREGASDAYSLAKEVAKAILAHSPERIAKRDLAPKVRAFRAAHHAEQDSALRILVDLSWIRPMESTYMKQAPTSFVVNPRLKSKYAAAAERERMRRAAVREMLADSINDRRQGSQSGGAA